MTSLESLRSRSIVRNVGGSATSRRLSEFARSWYADRFLLIVAFFIVATASFNGFYDKWNFRDNDPKFSFAAMVDGTGDRPYVYRQLLPMAANGFETSLPSSSRGWLTDALYASTGQLKSGLRSTTAKNPAYALRYHFIYYGTFVILFAALFATRAVCLSFGFAALPSTVAAGMFGLAMPFLQTVGGYFYDYSELLFMMTAVLMIQRQRLLILVPLAVVATLNKESFLFYLITLFPFIRQSKSLKLAGLWTAGLVGIAGLTYLVVRSFYAGNPGVAAHTHVWEAMTFYLNPLSLVGREINYGLKTFAGYSLVSLLAIGLVAVRGWTSLPIVARQNILLATVVNLPLFLLLCYPGEMRNLSMLYVGFVLLLAVNFQGKPR